MKSAAQGRIVCSMRALIMRDGELRVDTLPDPEPGPGQVLVRNLACGICASDIHLLAHGERLANWSREHGGPFRMDTKRDLVMGHEFCGEVLDFGPDTQRAVAMGTRVTSVPHLLHAGGFAVLGYDNEFPGAFGECMLLSEAFLRPVPDSLPTDVAALTEPLSTGFQYARSARLQPGDVPLVVGCGAIGLAVIAALHRAGVEPIVASDLSPHRRELAAATGAHEVVDPRETPALEAWQKAASRIKNASAVVFECVGVPGVLGEIFEAAPWSARIVVAGVCLEPDPLFTAAAHTKGLNVQFGGIPIPEDFDGALRAISDGHVDVGAWLTGQVDLDGSVQAFDDARDAAKHTRIIVRP